MRIVSRVCVAVLGGWMSASPAFSLEPDPAIECVFCEAWNEPQQPFRIFDNTYYVGTKKLSSILIDSGAGLILIDGGLPQSATLIATNIEALGFRLRDVKLILNSHVHYDHSGGIAALQRPSGATMVLSADSAQAFAQGLPISRDPQFGMGDAMAFPPVGEVKIISDGDTLQLGSFVITAHLTPGHTPGGTTWTWHACEGKTCQNVVYADSLTAVSAPAYRFSGNGQEPGLGEELRASIKKIGALPCDIFLTTHADFFGLEEKFNVLQQGAAANPFIDPSACEEKAEFYLEQLNQRLLKEQE